MKLFSIYRIFPSKLNTVKRCYSELSYMCNMGNEPLKLETVGNVLENTAKLYGSRTAVKSRHQNISLTYIEAIKRADRLAASFIKLGLIRGDRVGIWATNSLEWYLTAFACARSGLILVNINPAYQRHELEYCINKVKCKVLVMQGDYKLRDCYPILQDLFPNLEKGDPRALKSSNVPSLQSVVVVSDIAKRGTFAFSELETMCNDADIKEIQNIQKDIQADDPCCIMYTSGTTGKPKASILSHFNLVNNAELMLKRAKLYENHHLICLPVPFFHTYGYTFGIIGVTSAANTMILPSPIFSGIETLNALSEENCTVTCGTPTMHIDVVNLQKEKRLCIEDLEVGFTAGAVCTPQLFRDMKRVLNLKNIFSLFGMTETTSAVYESLENDNEEKITTTVGYISDHVEAKVVDDNGCLVPKGQPGELCIRAYSNMLGYWDDPEKTKEVISSDKWLKTGDKFIMDPDGYGRIIGRIKDMINRGGENIFPKEIEDLISTHPDVIDCTIIGLPHKRLGEEVCACVVLRNGSTLNLNIIKEFCKGHISDFKIPSVLKIVDDYPKTVSGKIQKFKLVEKYS